MAARFNAVKESEHARREVKAGKRPHWYTDRFVNIDWVENGEKHCKLGALNLRLTESWHARLIAKLDGLDEAQQQALLGKLLRENIRVTYQSVERKEEDTEKSSSLLDEF